jgi:hypothetical protein
MFVRSKKRATRKQVYRYRQIGGRRVWAKASEPTGDYALSAQLVECHRIDGKPRQRVVKYLGIISQGQIASVNHRTYFWRHVGAALSELALPAEQQRAIELALHERVPFPTNEEAAAAAEHLQQLTQRIHQSLGR